VAIRAVDISAAQVKNEKDVGLNEVRNRENLSMGVNKGMSRYTRFGLAQDIPEISRRPSVAVGNTDCQPRQSENKPAGSDPLRPVRNDHSPEAKTLPMDHTRIRRIRTDDWIISELSNDNLICKIRPVSVAKKC
jgi:hypothetical protein